MQHSFIRFLFLCAAMALATNTAYSADPAAPAPAREIKISDTQFVRGGQTPAWIRESPIPATTKTQPAVTRLADTQFRIDKNELTYVRRVIQVNDSSALAQIGQLQLDFAPEYSKLHLLSLRILRGTQVIDLTKTVDVRFLQREAKLENGTYSGTVTASLVLNDVRVGDTMDLRYMTEGANPVFGGKFSDWASWDQPNPTELRSIIVSHPVNRSLKWQGVSDLREFTAKPEITERNGYRYLEWTVQDLDVVDFETYMPEDYLPVRVMQFSEYKDWNAVARWADALFPEVKSLPPELNALVSEISKLPDQKARAAAALRWVQEEIRYFSVSFGESSHRPHPPAEVLKQRFGDCKDKSYLLTTLLHRLGIEAQPMLVSLRTPRSTARLLPMPTVFDHAIVHARIDGSDYYLDGTRLGQRGQLDKIGPTLEGAYGLIVAPDTQALKQITNPNIKALSTISLSEDIKLAGFGDTGTLQSVQRWRGNYAEAMRLAFAQITANQIRQYALSNYELRYANIALTGDPQINDDKEANEISMTATFTIPKLAVEAGMEWGIRYAPSVMQRIANIPQQTKRTFPMVGLIYPYNVTYSLTIDWPQSVSMAADPSTRRYSNDFYTLETHNSFRGNQSKFDMSFETRDTYVAPKQVSKYIEDIRMTDRYIGNYITVSKDAIKSNGDLGKATLQETISQRLKKRVEQLSKSIDSGRLSGNDLAEAYCERAETQADLGNTSASIKDAAEASKLAPDSISVTECRASVSFFNGDLGKAITDYSKAIRNGSAGFANYYGRGRARFYDNKLSDAADDFLKAGRLTDEGGDKLYADLWYIWTMQRLGKPLAEEVRKRAEENPRGAWPRPALAMLIGKITPEQMLEEVNKKTGDERELNLTEAKFYLGQYYLNQGKAAAARTAFEEVRKQGITMYVEHVAAGLELARMKLK